MKFTAVELPYNFQNLKDHELTNDLFILNDTFFVKRSKEITKAFLNLTNQLNVIQILRNQPFSLPILEAQITEDKLWVLMPYYHNLTTLSDQQITKEILQELSQLVQQLHEVEIKATDNIIKWEPIKQLNLYCNLIETNNTAINDIRTDLETWVKSYQPKKIVLCHNDLVPNNFVYHENKWYLIDWDFTTLNDPLFDVASFASETLKAKADVEYWYSLFNLSETELVNVQTWVKYQNLIWYHWAMFLYQKTKNKTYETIADEKLKMLLA
ncbi:phosphotransferase [Spiroplasma platyhelix]|uniref:Phosphotransferase n=1 Tax=Spiroplasma platyhelix PALS-1 TaxID=1276218 RepID=A0A846U4G1_9MOLU|nr:phosphotransferase [Spiroplasma platyhelix]MBE4703974.1 hypothetical protein [Spiroplasma platyhelix PALS-1]NKE38347.1 phosphotransferase [Spiroplasma platyhelix PALS-1]UJB29232.1 hypothetical protein SPLAT_v1c04680 [Spiroplasma platyhelix PALS-1]